MIGVHVGREALQALEVEQSRLGSEIRFAASGVRREKYHKEMQFRGQFD